MLSLYKVKNLKSKSKSKFVFGSILLFYLLLFAINEYFTNVASVNFLINSIVVTVLISFLLIRKTFYLHNLVSLFFVTFSLFIFSRIFLSFLGLNSIRESYSFYYGTIDEKSLVKALFVVIISFISVLFGVYLNKSKEQVKDRFKRINFINVNKSYGKLIVIVFLILLPGTLYKYYFDLGQILNEGYLSLYSREAIESAPFFSRLSWYLYTLFLPIIFAVDFGSKKKTKLLIALLLAVSLLDALKGSRAAFVRPLMFCFWYYYTFYSEKEIKLSKLLPILGALLFFTLFMLLNRTDAKVDINSFKIISDLVFHQQGVSFTIIALYFQFQDQILYPTKFYLITSITSPLQFLFDRDVFASGRNFEMVKQTFNIDYKLMYAINSKMFFNGYGVGGSYMIELYAFMGILTVVLGSIITGYFIVSFEINILRKGKAWLVIFAWYWVNHIVFFSRGSFGLNLFNICLTFLIFNFLKYLFESYKLSK